MISKTFKLTLITAVVAVLASLAIVHFANSAAATTSAVGDAASTFNSKCAKCHGKDGRSHSMRGRMTHARDLTNAQWQNDVTDERLFNSISNGKGKMPSFKKEFSEDQIDELVRYVRQLKR